MQVKKAKGAILVESRQPLVIDEFDLPETLLPGHVLVKIHHTSICGAQINEIDAVKGVVSPASLARVNKARLKPSMISPDMILRSTLATSMARTSSTHS
jgi:hypothetical protein